ETAEMPGLYQNGDFDLAGAIVGIVERDRVIDGSSIVAGDVIFALPSNGLHTNGYSLVRRVIEQSRLQMSARVEAFGSTLAEELLRIHRSYLAAMTAVAQLAPIKGLAHITGGGIVENLPRILPDGTGARIHKGTWPVLPIFEFIAREGDVVEGEMYRVFNMGVGMLVVVGAAHAAKMPERVEGITLYRVGEIIAGDRTVQLV
ncbi:MAG TPA: phosphoribosylformylglycinamidine cyclo-ligase, partial [Candidatus Krumholzibacteria bacterium]|nr:phosphoribosylformylglycinamidine cyclo-ligase [Candidatus Krumholzibacteria bacterium]